jgi:hypothetical protein
MAILILNGADQFCPFPAQERQKGHWDRIGEAGMPEFRQE